MTWKNGIPSHDTFVKVFAGIDTEEFSICCSRCDSELAITSDGEFSVIEGKTTRRSIDNPYNTASTQMISAWTHSNSLVFGKVKVGAKSNEIAAIPKLLERLDIAVAIITIDATGCQKKLPSN